MNRFGALEELEAALSERIVMLDGAMGTTLRDYGLSEEEVRGGRFAGHDKDLLNNGEILSLTRPDVIADIHRRFFEAGADIVETNTFSATELSQSEFFKEDPREKGGRKDPGFYDEVLADASLREMSAEMNRAAASLAREQAEKSGEALGRRCWVAGAMGPLTVSLSVSPDAEDAGFRVVDFEQVVETYRRQVRALIEGGVDLLMVETIFDSLNAKAALVAIREVLEEDGFRPVEAVDSIGEMAGRGSRRMPAIVSAAVGMGGETMISGQVVEAFWIAVRHANPLAVGLNCSLGPRRMRPHLETLSKIADTHVSCYPNAGDPDPLSPTGFQFGAGEMERMLAEFARDGLVNILGGCCGNTPEHIRLIAEAAKGLPPRQVPESGK
jgi:5-methyltetrahydrofolate--homocysteine methyltransferase